MSISAGDTVELKGTVSSVTDSNNYTLSLTEMYLSSDNKFRSFTTAKTMAITTSDYVESNFSASEMAVIKLLADNNKSVSSYTEDQLQAINSIVNKLG